MNSLLQMASRARLELSREIEQAGYLPVKAKRARRVFKVLPVYYDGPDLGEPRRAVRRAKEDA